MIFLPLGVFCIALHPVLSTRYPGLIRDPIKV